VKKKIAYVVGERVSTSLSPTIFNYWISKYSINAEYGFKEIKNENFNNTIKEILEEQNLCGLNITTPFKEKIVNHLDQVDNHSKIIGAVNCVTVNNNKYHGSNTDWIGYSEALKMKTTKEDRINKEVMVIGYGGAAKAIVYALLFFEYKKIHIFNRSLLKFKNLVNKKIEAHSIMEIKNFINTSGLIINTIPISILSDLKIQKNLAFNTTISDIIYRPLETEFLSHFNNPQKKIYGLQMLIYQAIPCFEKWFGLRPEIDEKLLEITKNKIIK